MFLLGVLLLVGFAEAQNKCTNHSVAICVENMKQFKLNEYNAIVPTWNETQLSNLCGAYQETDRCIDRLIGDCSAYDQYYYKAVEDSWDYICRDKKQEYLDIRTCLAKADLHSQADVHCTNVWEKRILDLRKDKFRHATGVLNKDGLASLCNSANEYLNCIYTEVQNFCNAEAAAWMRGFDDTLIQPILKLVGCQAETQNGQKVYVYPDDNGGLSQTVIIIIAISIALGVLVMVIIAILLLRQSKKSRFRDAPPGEPGPYMVYSPEMGVMAGPMVAPPVPPSYKEKGDLGPEFGIPMPPPPGSIYEPPPSYRPAESVYNDGRSVASGRTARSHHTSRSHHSTAPPPRGHMI